MVGHTGISQSYLLAKYKAAYGSKSEITDHLKKFYVNIPKVGVDSLVYT